MSSVLGTVIVVIIVGVLWYAWQRVASWRRRVQQEAREAQGTLHNTFDVLREDVAEQMDALKDVRGKNQVKEEEEKAQGHIEESLDIAEQFAQKEIEDVEKEVE